jgi:hypothetical protein
LQFSFHAIWELFKHILNRVEPEALNMAIFAIYHESKVSIVLLNVDFTLPHTYFHVKWQNMAMFIQVLLDRHCIWFQRKLFGYRNYYRLSFGKFSAILKIFQNYFFFLLFVCSLLLELNGEHSYIYFLSFTILLFFSGFVWRYTGIIQADTGIDQIWESFRQLWEIFRQIRSRIMSFFSFCLFLNFWNLCCTQLFFHFFIILLFYAVFIWHYVGILLRILP